MTWGRKTGGRKKGVRNRANAEVRAAAAARGILPLDYMLEVMRDPTADKKRRDAMAQAAAPYLHQKLSSVDSIGISAGGGGDDEGPTIRVNFVLPPKREE
jgi:hypothetical protein